MPVKRAGAETQGQSRKKADSLRRLALVLNIRTGECVEPWTPQTPFEDELSNWLGQECLAAGQTAALDGFIAIAGGVSGVWAAKRRDRNLLDWLGQVEDLLLPLIKDTVRDQCDDPDARKEPLRSDDRGILWLRVFFDLNLERIHEKINTYADSVQGWERDRQLGKEAKPDDAATVPQDAYEEKVRDAARRSHAFRQQLAAELAPALNARIQEMPHDKLEAKKAICDLVEAALEPLGLAVKCPNTQGLPAKLKATTGNHQGVGTFYFEVYIDGKRKQPVYSDELPNLQLMDAYPPKELGSHFQDVVSQESSWSSRKR